MVQLGEGNTNSIWHDGDRHAQSQIHMKAAEPVFSPSWTQQFERTRENGLKLEQGRFRTDIMKK